MTMRESPAPPWRRALLWLAVIGVVFIGGYRATLLVASQGPAHVVSLPIDARLPFWPWTIIPYFALNLLVPVACLLQPARRALDRFGLRMLLGMGVCLSIFLIHPTTMAGPRPEVGMPWRVLYDALRAFDGPYNLVPSMHVVVTVLVWTGLRPLVAAGWPRAAWALACVTMALATLTTGQHHVLDVLAGLVVGIGACLLVPLREPR